MSATKSRRYLPSLTPTKLAWQRLLSKKESCSMWRRPVVSGGGCMRLASMTTDCLSNTKSNHWLDRVWSFSSIAKFSNPTFDCLDILSECLRLMRIFFIYLSEHVWKQCKRVTGLEWWWWWWCTELPPSVMDLLQRCLNLHSFTPAFADEAHPCLFYLRPCFGAACQTFHCFFTMSSYQCSSNCWCLTLNVV